MGGNYINPDRIEKNEKRKKDAKDAKTDAEKLAILWDNYIKG